MVKTLVVKPQEESNIFVAFVVYLKLFAVCFFFQRGSSSFLTFSPASSTR